MMDTTGSRLSPTRSLWLLACMRAPGPKLTETRLCREELLKSSFTNQFNNLRNIIRIINKQFSMHLCQNYTSTIYWTVHYRVAQKISHYQKSALNRI